MHFVLNRDNRPITLMLAFCLMVISIVSFESIRTMRPSLGLDMDQIWLTLVSAGFITGYLSLFLLLCAVWSYDQSQEEVG